MGARSLAWRARSPIVEPAVPAANLPAKWTRDRDDLISANRWIGPRSTLSSFSVSSPVIGAGASRETAGRRRGVAPPRTENVAAPRSPLIAHTAPGTTQELRGQAPRAGSSIAEEPSGPEGAEPAPAPSESPAASDSDRNKRLTLSPPADLWSWGRGLLRPH